MKKLLLVVLFLTLGSLSWAKEDAKDAAVDRLDRAAKVLTEIMNTPDKGIPEEVMEGAKCVAVVPHLIKGGFIFGAENGKGVATCRTAHGWSAPAFFTVTGGSWGAQIGVEGVDLVMLFMTDKGMEHLLANKVKIGADASAAAGPVGRHASAGTDWKLNTEILTYSRAKGAFAGITLNGSDLRRDDDSTEAMYGKEVNSRAVLMGQVPPPPAAHAFLAAVRGAKAESMDKKGF